MPDWYEEKHALIRAYSRLSLGLSRNIVRCSR
jgi:hypothetical protein